MGNTPRKTPDTKLWEVGCKSSYNDDGFSASVDISVYVLAESQEEAFKKAEHKLTEEIDRYTQLVTCSATEIRNNAKITTSPVSLETLVASRKVEGLNRVFRDVEKVELSLEEDRQKYRLGVCLIPIDK